MTTSARTARTARLIGIVLISATSVVACGGTESTDTTSSGDIAASAETVASPDTATDATNGTAGTTSSAVTEAVGSTAEGDPGGARSQEAFCTTWLQVEGGAFVAEGEGDAGVLRGLEELERSAPDEIANEAEAVVELFTLLLDFEAAVEAGTLEEDDPVYEQADTDIDRNGEALEAYVEANCALES